MTTSPVIVIVGNPQPASRTARAATLLGGRVAQWMGEGTAVELIDLAELGPKLLDWKDPDVADAVDRVVAARALVVASPTYKATYTGLLKLFLERFEHGQLGGLTAVPLMTGGNIGHSLALAVHLVPLLTEIGASVPAPGIFLAGPDIDDPHPAIDTWATTAERPIRRVVTRP